MLKPLAKKITITFSCFASVLIPTQEAFGQLNLGRYGVQRGLETNYLQYQISGQKLSQMRGIPGCAIGYGLNCNKTAAVIEELLEARNGPSYQDLLVKAAGGEENLRKFAAFYNNNPNLDRMPYASFWQDDSPLVVDGYRYLLGGTVKQAPVSGLGLVTKNFYWTPLQGSGDSLDLRSGLLNLKYSFGRLLYEEMAKIPNIEQQIHSLNLPQDMTKFYLEKIAIAKQALSTSDSRLLKDSILNVLSIPFDTEGTQFGRPNIGIPSELDQLTGEGLSPDVFVGLNPVFLSPDAIAVDVPSTIPESPSPENIVPDSAVVQQGSGNSLRGWLIGGGGLVLLLLLLSLGGGGGDRDRAFGQPPLTVGTTTPDTVPPTTPSGCGLPGDSNQAIEIPCTPSVIYPPGDKVERIPESSAISPYLLLLIVLFLSSRVCRKQVRW
ncbi:MULTISPECIES: hypothetical protein [Nostocales]|uniref:Uncharacterized protein n=3 Tax=Nostocales TaxID=1161 RepID=A0A0C1RIL3_9CYAN|nr:hypothetical protein [Tolypothrix bouteillei]KAF3884723.1 hypothetical protein DA73_0400003985 [Tolypothrix bouteillei VB521301]